MPRRSKGPRLYLRRARPSIGRKAVWLIRDGQRDFATGCIGSPADKGPPEGAQRALANYIANKYRPSCKTRDIEQIDIADVLSIYLDDCGDDQADRKKFEARISRLNSFWGGRMLSEVSTATCKEYVKVRGNSGGARRDLEDLRAAIGHHASENLHRAIVNVWLPPKGAPRDRWLTRSEAAQLLWLVGVTARFKHATAGPPKAEGFPPRSGLCATWPGSFLLGSILVHAPAPLQLPPRNVLQVAPLLILTKGFSIVTPKASAPRTSVSPRRRYRRACWATCGGGSALAWLEAISSNSTASRFCRLRPLSHELFSLLGCRPKAARSFRIRYGTPPRRGSCNAVCRSGKRLDISACRPKYSIACMAIIAQTI